MVEVLDKKIGEFSMSILCKNKLEENRWIFSGIYGPSNQFDFEVVREYLCQINAEWDVLCCIECAFNTIRCLGERLGASNFTHHMQNFNDFTKETGLVDLPLWGGPYTWSNYRASSRLDHFLFSEDWLKHMSFSQEVTSSLGSNHSPILLHPIAFASGSRPFKFEVMWLKVLVFKEKIKN